MSAYSAPAKSTGTAYLLWFFFGPLGAHKFYLRNATSGALYLAGWLAFWVLLAVKAGLLVASLPIAALWIALTWDLFTLPGQVRAANAGEASETKAPTERTSLFTPKDQPFDEGAAEAAIQRYLATNGASSGAARSGAVARSGAKPVFGRR